MLPTSSLARLVAWHKVAVAAAACWSALVGLIPLACLIIPVHQAAPRPSESVILIPPVRYERATPVAEIVRPQPASEPVAIVAAPEPEPEPAPVAVALAVEAKPAPVVAAPAPDKCVACEQGAPDPAGNKTYGTAIKFNGNPLQAADEAAKDKRLLFVLHISGNFEDDRFT